MVRGRARTTALSGRIVAPAGGCVQGYVGRLRAHLRRDDRVGHRAPPNNEETKVMFSRDGGRSRSRRDLRAL